MPARSAPTAPTLDAEALNEIEELSGREARTRGPFVNIDQMQTHDAAAHELQAALRENLPALLAAARERDELRAALATIHRTTGRGDGHGTVAATESCVLDAFLSAREAVAEAKAEMGAAEKERDEARVSETGERARAAYLEGALIAIGEYAEKHSHFIAMASVSRAVKDAREALASDPFGPKGTEGT